MRKRNLKRGMAAALSLSLLVSAFPQTIMAYDGYDEEALAAELESYSDKYPSGAFAFYNSQIEVSENDGSAFVDIVRMGGTEGKASVTFKAIDVSAVYGKDYTLSVDEGLFITREPEQDEDAKPIAELFAETGGDAVIGEEQPTEPEAENVIEMEISPNEGIVEVNDGKNETSAELTEKETEEEAEETEAEIELFGDAEEEQAAEKSEKKGLKEAWEASTGKKSDRKTWQELTGTENGEAANLANEMSANNGYIEEFAKDLPGTEYTLSFGDGEYLKRVKVNLTDDDISETDEQVILVLMNEDGAELAKPNTAYLNILDNDENEPVVFGLTDGDITVFPEDGYAYINVERLSGIEKFASVVVGTGAITAEPGKDYEAGSTEIIFPQGVTSKTVKVPVYDTNRGEDVSFAVAIDTESSFADEALNSVAVTIKGKGNSPEISETEAEENGISLMSEDGDDDEDTQLELFSSTETVQPKIAVDSPSSGTNFGSAKKVAGGLDLRNATRIDIEYAMSGKYEYKYQVKEGTGCKKKVKTVTGYRYGKDAQLTVAGKSVQLPANKTTVTVNLDKGNKLKNQDIFVKVRRTESGDSGKVTYTINKITVHYEDIVISVDNSRSAENNLYTEKVYEAGGAKTNGDVSLNDGNEILLGEGRVKGSTTYTAKKYSDAVPFSVTAPSANEKTTEGIAPVDGKNVYLAGWQVYNSEKNKYDDEVIKPDLMSLETLYSKYGHKTSFQVRPVIYPYTSFVKFDNSNANSLAYTNNIADGKELKVTMLDTLKIAGVGINNSGYAVGSFVVKGFYDTNLHATGGTKRADNANAIRGYDAGRITDYINKHKSGNYQVKKSVNEADSSAVTLMPDCEVIYLDMSFTQPKIEVMYNPSASAPKTHKEDGEVFYFDTENTQNSVDGSWKKPMTIAPVKYGSLYNVNTVYSDSAAGGMSKFKTVWQDFTGDTNKNGQLTESEQKPLRKYSLDRNAVIGDTFTYNPRVTNSLIYYYITERAQAKAPGYIDGTVVLKEYPIFGGKDVTYTPVNGAAVTVDGVTVATEYNEYYGGTEGTGGDGYFSVSDNSFISGEAHRVNVVYGPLSAAASQNVNVSQQYVLDAYDTISVSNATRAKNGEQLGVGDVMYNDDANYTLSFVTKSSKSAVVADKAILKFYRKDGSLVTEREYSSTGELTGIFECTFNPKALGLPAGGRITVTFKDNEGTTYFEHNTGISLMQSLGAISLVTSFSGKAAPVLQVIGKVSSAFNFGWDGNLDDTEATIGSNGNYSITTADGKKVLNLGLEFATSGGTNSGKKTKEEVKNAAKSTDTAAKAEAAKSADNGKNETKSQLAVGFDAKFTFGISLTLAASEDEAHKGEWYFEEFLVVVNAGGNVSASKSFVTPIGIPVIVGAGIGADGQAIVVVERRLGGPEYYMADLTSGNSGSVDLINKGQSLSDYMYVYGDFVVAPHITVNAGVGVDMFNIKLHGNADFTFNFNTQTNDGSGNVTFSCKLSIKILGFERNFNLGNDTFDLFSEGATLSESLDTFKVSDRAYLENRGEWDGTNENIDLMSVSGMSEKALLSSGINPNADIKMVALSDGKYFAIFIDDVPTRTAINSKALYYTIYNGSEWSTPEILDDDGTADDTPAIKDLENGKYFVTWSSASRVFADDANLIDVLNSRDIKAVFVNKFDGAIGDIINVTYETEDDKYSDSDARVGYDSESKSMIICYTKSEYEATGSEEGVYGDVVYPYDVITCRLYSLGTETFLDIGDPDLEGDWYGQVFVDVAPRVVVNETLDEYGYWVSKPTFSEVSGISDPKIIEKDVISYNGLVLLAYVLDFDGKKDTTADRDVFMQIYNFRENEFSHPIMITSNNVEEKSLHFVRVAGSITFLSYISDGSIKMLDVSSNISNPNILKTGRTDSGVLYYYFDKSKDGGYIPEMVVIQATGGGDYSGEQEIADFEISSGDENFYIMFTERTSKLRDGITPGSPEAALAENNLVETQIYMTRYDIENSELTNPVAVTEEGGANYANIAFAVDDYYDGFVALATKSMSATEAFEGQTISTDGSDNSGLYCISFTPEANVMLKNPTIEGIGAGRNALASLEVYNGGLKNAENLKIEVTDENGNAIEVPQDGLDKLIGGERKEIAFSLPVAEEANGAGFTAVVKNDGGVIDTITYSDSVQRTLDVVSFGADITDRGIIKYSAVLNNNASVAGEAREFKVKAGDTLLATASVEPLKPGETKEISGDITFDYDELFTSKKDNSGAVGADTVLTATAGDGSLTDTVSVYASAEQMARMNAITDVSLTSLGDVKVYTDGYYNLETKITAENYNGRFKDNNESEIGAQGVTVKYSSDDESIAKVYENGCIEGIAVGSATITAQILPQESTFDGVDYVSDYPTLPKEAIKTYTVKVNVEEAPITSGGILGSPTSSYTVKFETNGADTIESQKVKENGNVTEPKPPVKDGYTFDGWYTDKESTEKYDFGTKVVKNITLYAKWNLVKADGAGSGSGSGEIGGKDDKNNNNDKNNKDNVQIPIIKQWNNPFVDVKESDWFYGGVKFVNENGLMSGVTDAEFAPSLTLTRGMLVTVLYRLAGSPSVNKSIPFIDVAADKYYHDAVVWAAQNGIVTGINDEEFAPEENITREQIAAILYRYAKAMGYDVSVGESTNILSYTDFGEISEFAIESMQYAVGSGLIKGKTESTLNPKDFATRAEIALILQRFIEANNALKKTN